MANQLAQRISRFFGGRAIVLGLLAILTIYGFEAHARNREKCSSNFSRLFLLGLSVIDVIYNAASVTG